MKDPQRVFDQLSAILRPYGDSLHVETDTADHLYLNTHHTMRNGKPLFFGAVQVMKRYVSFHLMPVYVHPELLDAVSPDLRRRMQGKSCFNFTAPDAALFEELAGLVEAGYKSYEASGYVEARPS